MSVRACRNFVKEWPLRNIKNITCFSSTEISKFETSNICLYTPAPVFDRWLPFFCVQKLSKIFFSWIWSLAIKMVGEPHQTETFNTTLLLWQHLRLILIPILILILKLILKNFLNLCVMSSKTKINRRARPRSSTSSRGRTKSAPAAYPQPWPEHQPEPSPEALPHFHHPAFHHSSFSFHSIFYRTCLLNRHSFEHAITRS